MLDAEPSDRSSHHRALVWAGRDGNPHFAPLLRLTAPYGRHYSGRGWGPQMSNRAGWIVMELPATVLFGVIFFMGSAAGELVPLILLGVWQCHYLNRNFIFPLRTRTAGKTMPIVVAGSGFAFNVVNAYVNARFISHFGAYGPGWLADPRFLAGLAIFATGFALNIHSDNILLGLRKSGGSGYSIPRGGVFRHVSCLTIGRTPGVGRMGLATWSLGGLAFFTYTAPPRTKALKPHRWYRERFEDYPPAQGVDPGGV